MTVLLKSLKFKNPDEPGDGFPFNLPIIARMGALEFTSSVTFFVGENGSGKSTLLEGIAAGMNAVAVAGQSIHEDPLLAPARALGQSLRFSRSAKPKLSLFFRAEDSFGFTRKVMADQQEFSDLEAEYDEKFQGYGRILAKGMARGQKEALNAKYGEEPDAMSHGENFLNVFQQRVQPGGLYLLDEPETPLSPIRQLSLLALMKDRVEEGAQFVIATHSPILMAFPEAQIFEFADGDIREVAYDDVEHVAITRAFLNDPEQFLRRL